MPLAGKAITISSYQIPPCETKISKSSQSIQRACRQSGGVPFPIQLEVNVPRRALIGSGRDPTVARSGQWSAGTHPSAPASSQARDGLRQVLLEVGHLRLP